MAFKTPLLLLNIKTRTVKITGRVVNMTGRVLKITNGFKIKTRLVKIKTRLVKIKIQLVNMTGRVVNMKTRVLTIKDKLKVKTRLLVLNMRGQVVNLIGRVLYITGRGNIQLIIIVGITSVILLYSPLKAHAEGFGLVDVDQRTENPFLKDIKGYIASLPPNATRLQKVIHYGKPCCVAGAALIMLAIIELDVYKKNVIKTNNQRYFDSLDYPAGYPDGYRGRRFPEVQKRRRW